MRTDIKEWKDGALGYPTFRQKKKPAKGASGGIGGAIEIAYKRRECLSVTENYTLLGIREK